MKDPVQVRSFLGMPAVIASPGLSRLVETAQRVAQTNATVLITGESGSGKELVARSIHHFSLRSACPWVDVSCGALPEQLMESELFGYEKGAFSGAESAKPGLFELASRGTLFLDEIGELEPKMQVKLLRVLDGVPYYRLGGVKKVSVDVRIVAATNQDLGKMVEQGRFRADLYHRLSQITLAVPPLRERPEDVIPLALHFLEQYNPKGYFSDRALAQLRQHSWPGNVRELRNVVVRTAVLAKDGCVESISFENGSQPYRADDLHGASLNLDGIERRTILRALERTNGHQQKAAELLGISRRTLSRKLKTYGLDSGVSCAS
jgi:transcriptional regulator with PAS, ATPase and Fis domain